MKFFVITFSIVIFFVGCSPDQTTHRLDNVETKLLKDFQDLPAESRLEIAAKDEPGERLKLCITIVDKKSKKTLKNQKIHFYHTSAIGEYEPKIPADESTARLNGSAVTDAHGRVYVETILPGDYGTSPNNRHIHTSIFGAKPVGYDIHFKQYTGLMGKNFIDSSDQHFLADLKKDKNDELVTFITLEPKFRDRKNLAKLKADKTIQAKLDLVENIFDQLADSVSTEF